MSRLVPGPRHREWSPAPARYVALDVDGTLVGPGGAVSDGVAAACAEARAAGLHVGLATGRMAQGVADVLARTDLGGPHVLHNGGEVRLDGDVVHSAPITPAAARALVDTAIAQRVYVEVYLDDGFAVTTEDDRAEPHWQLLGHEPRAVLHAGDDLDGLTTRVPKVTAIAFEPPEVERIVALLEDAGLVTGAAGSPATPELMYVNGNDPAADKGSALRAAARAVGCELAAVVAVGDGDNDLPLLRAAGTAIAMGQAGDRVRSLAHLIAPSVADDGAATAIRAAVAGFAEEASERAGTGEP